ncbi:MAG: radical SAM family heme chaperone HemW, partial [Ramlibacter sp.]
GNPVHEEHEIARADMGFEFMLNTLRLTEGFDPNLFGERTGLSITMIEKALDEAESKGLLYRDFRLIKPTELGQRFLNDLQEMFLGG